MMPQQNPRDDTRFTARRALVLAFVLAGASALGWAVFSLPLDASGLTGPALEQLAKSGVTNPVTAAVLNYRGYDTLIEIGVLLLSVLGVWSVAKADTFANPPPASPVLWSFLRLVLPVMLLIVGYLLWIGSFAPGGAFQAGAILAGAIVLWLLADAGRTPLPRAWMLRVTLALGLVVFIAVAVGVMLPGGKLLEYPPAHAGSLILLIESAALVSIAATLAALFLGGRLANDSDATNSAKPQKGAR